MSLIVYPAKKDERLRLEIEHMEQATDKIRIEHKNLQAAAVSCFLDLLFILSNLIAP